MTSDEQHVRRAIELARANREVRGGAPFASLLVDDAGTVLREECNTVLADDDVTAHPELKLARWAARELSLETARTVTMYTSCEPCGMCAGAIDRAGLRRVVFAMSGATLGSLQPSAAVQPVPVAGPFLEDEAVEALADHVCVERPRP